MSELNTASCNSTKQDFFPPACGEMGPNIDADKGDTGPLYVLLPHAWCWEVRKHFLLNSAAGQYRELVLYSNSDGRSSDVPMHHTTLLTVVALCSHGPLFHIQTRNKQQHSQSIVSADVASHADDLAMCYHFLIFKAASYIIYEHKDLTIGTFADQFQWLVRFSYTIDKSTNIC